MFIIPTKELSNFNVFEGISSSKQQTKIIGGKHVPMQQKSPANQEVKPQADAPAALSFAINQTKNRQQQQI